VMSLILWGWLGLTSERAVWLVAGGGVVLGGLVYGLGVLALKVPEVQTLLRVVVRRLKLAHI